MSSPPDLRARQTSSVAKALPRKSVVISKERNRSGYKPRCCGYDASNRVYSYGAGGWSRCSSDRNLICMQQANGQTGGQVAGWPRHGMGQNGRISSPTSPPSPRVPNCVPAPRARLGEWGRSHPHHIEVSHSAYCTILVSM